MGPILKVEIHHFNVFFLATATVENYRKKESRGVAVVLLAKIERSLRAPFLFGSREGKELGWLGGDSCILEVDRVEETRE